MGFTATMAARQPRIERQWTERYYQGRSAFCESSALSDRALDYSHQHSPRAAAQLHCGAGDSTMAGVVEMVAELEHRYCAQPAFLLVAERVTFPGLCCSRSGRSW